MPSNGSDRVMSNQELYSAVESLGEQPKYSSEGSPYSVQPLLDLFGADTDKDACLERIASFSKAQARRFFGGLHGILRCVVEQEDYIPQAALQQNNDDDDDDDTPIDYDNIQMDDEAMSVLTFIQVCAQCITKYVNVKLDASSKNNGVGKTAVGMIVEVFHVISGLHRVLLYLSMCGKEGKQVQNAILDLCESWWYANGHNREEIIVHCLPLLVMQTLENDKSNKNRAKRLYRLKEAFLIVDFSSPNSAALRDLMLRLVSNPMCLKTKEGQGFLASLMLEPDLLEPLHSAMWAQMPDASKKVLAAYGEIYMRAWHESLDLDSDDMRTSLELDVLQRMIHHLVHAASDAVRNRLMDVLGPLHKCKKSNSNAQDLLHRLYAPILWRSITTANFRVRLNAITVMADVFPLQESGSVNTKEAVAKSTTALKTALLDNDPRVRVAAATAAAKILSMYWSALPTNDIREVLNLIILKHASDSKSAPVRRSALTTITSLLDVPESKAVLRPLLPFLGNLIHDKSQSVRLGVIALLQRVKTLKSIKFYHIVPVDQLVIRLSEEEQLHRTVHNPVASALSSLLLNSYFPQGSRVSATDQLKRALTFMASTPDSAIAFFANVTHHLSDDAALKLASMLIKCLVSSVEIATQGESDDEERELRQPKRRKSSKAKHGGAAEASASNEALSASNTALMATIARVLQRLLESVDLASDEDGGDKENGQNSCEKAKFVSCFDSETQIYLYTYFFNKFRELKKAKSSGKAECLQVCTSLIVGSSKLPPHRNVEYMRYISNDIVDTKDALSRSILLPYVLLLCRADKVEQVADDLKTTIEKVHFDALGVDLLSPEAAIGGRAASQRNQMTFSPRRTRGQTASLLARLPGRLSLRLLHTILASTESMCHEIRTAIFAKADAATALRDTLDHVMKSLKSYMSSCDGFDDGHAAESAAEGSLLLLSWECYGRYLMHEVMHQSESAESTKRLKEFFAWSFDNVVARLKHKPMEIPLCNLDISRISNASESMVIFTSPRSHLSGATGGPESMDWGAVKKEEKKTSSQEDKAVGEDKKMDANADVEEKKETTKCVMTSATKVAATALQIMCLLLSEALAIGLKIHPHHWFLSKLMTYGSDIISDEKLLDQACREGVFDSFLRLAYQLCMKNEFALLPEIMACEGVGDESMDFFRKAVSKLTGTRSRCKSEVIKAILEAAKNHLAKNGDGTDPNDADAITNKETWEDDSALVGNAMSIVLENEVSADLAKKQTLLIQES